MAYLKDRKKASAIRQAQVETRTVEIKKTKREDTKEDIIEVDDKDLAVFDPDKFDLNKINV